MPRKSVVVPDSPPDPPAYPPLERARLTMPRPDFERLRALKARLKALDRPTRKNELLRAGLRQLDALDDEALMNALEGLPPAKPPKPSRFSGRPQPASARSRDGRGAKSASAPGPQRGARTRRVRSSGDAD